MTEKDEQRAKITADIARYLASGHTIDSVDHTASQASKQPAKRSKLEQIGYMKRTNRRR